MEKIAVNFTFDLTSAISCHTAVMWELLSRLSSSIHCGTANVVGADGPGSCLFYRKRAVSKHADCKILNSNKLTRCTYEAVLKVT